jgi:ribosomal protein S18 acetylase RimI-like enzyme
MHIVDVLTLPHGYSARPYRGVGDLPEMLECLIEHRLQNGEDEMPTLEQMINTYSHLTDCDVDVDIAVFHTGDGERVGYCRASHEDLANGTRDCVVFAPIRPLHLTELLYRAVATGMERHMAARAAEAPPARYRAYAEHPGPGLAPTGMAAWLEGLGYAATEWGASLLRPHLDDIPDRPLPDGVEVRPVTTDQVRHIWEVHHEAFRDDWDFHEMTDDEIDEMIADPVQDPSLWQVAWVGDQVVGQVKPFINHEENARRGYLRGYAEFISTHRDWRNRGIATALLARSLHVLRERGMTEAMVGVDTNNPGGALHVYTQLGFELQHYNAVYTKPVNG